MTAQNSPSCSPIETMMVATLSLLMVWATTPVALAQEGVPVRVLNLPDAVLDNQWSRISSLYEFADGRLLVVDEYEQAVFLATFRTGAQVLPVGRRGTGPGEYLAPSRVLPLGGDSVAIVDAANGRLSIMRSDLRFGGSVDIPSRTITASDERGNLYSEALPIRASPSGASLVDSAAIERWSPGSAVADTVGYVGRPVPSGTRVVGGLTARPLADAQRDYMPFAGRVEWAIGSDGRIAIVNHEPYRVTLIRPGIGRRDGVAISASLVRVTEAHKVEWREEEGRPRLMRHRSRGEGVTGAQWVSEPAFEPHRWPTYLPPFLQNAVRFGPQGRLWVQRTTLAGAAASFDIFDDTGKVISQVRLPPGRRLVGFGKGVAYLVRPDNDDLEILERYRLPPM